MLYKVIYGVLNLTRHPVNLFLFFLVLMFSEVDVEQLFGSDEG